MRNRSNGANDCRDNNDNDKINIKEEQLDDAQLLARIVQGDKVALYVIYNRYVDQVCGYVDSILSSSGLSYLRDDVTLQTFKKLLDKAESISVKDKLLPWLFTVAGNHAKDELRKRRLLWKYFTEVISLDEEMGGSVSDLRGRSPFQMLIMKETLNGVLGLIEQLPERRRRIFKAYVFENLSARQIAEMYAMNIDTVRTNIFSAREAIRRHLQMETIKEECCV